MYIIKESATRRILHVEEDWMPANGESDDEDDSKSKTVGDAVVEDLRPKSDKPSGTEGSNGDSQ